MADTTMRALASMATTATLRPRTMGHAVCTYAVHGTACSCIDGDSLGLFARAEARNLTVKAKSLGPALSRWHACLPNDPMGPKTSTVAASDVPEDRRHRHGTSNRLPAEAAQPASAGCCRKGQRWSASIPSSIVPTPSRGCATIRLGCLLHRYTRRDHLREPICDGIRP